MVKSIGSLTGYGLNIVSKKNITFLLGFEDVNSDDRELGVIDFKNFFSFIHEKKYDLTTEQLNDPLYDFCYTVCCSPGHFFNGNYPNIPLVDWSKIPLIWVKFTKLNFMSTQELNIKGYFSISRITTTNEDGSIAWGEWNCEFDKLYQVLYPVGTIICNLNSSPPVLGNWEKILSDRIVMTSSVVYPFEGLTKVSGRDDLTSDYTVQKIFSKHTHTAERECTKSLPGSTAVTNFITFPNHREHKSSVFKVNRLSTVCTTPYLEGIEYTDSTVNNSLIPPSLSVHYWGRMS